MVALLTHTELYALMDAARRSGSYGFSVIYCGDRTTHAWMADVDGWYTETSLMYQGLYGMKAHCKKTEQKSL